MNRTPVHVPARLLLLAGLSLCTAMPARAQAEVEAMRRCRGIADVAQRAACYDAIPLPGPAATPAARASAGPGAATPSAAAAVAPATGGFGLPPQQRAPEAEFIDSHIAGAFDGWLPRGKLRLANGQVWEVTDGSEAVYNLTNPKVRLTRGMLGTYFMRIEGVSQTPRVRRVQ